MNIITDMYEYEVEELLKIKKKINLTNDQLYKAGLYNGSGLPHCDDTKLNEMIGIDLMYFISNIPHLNNLFNNRVNYFKTLKNNPEIKKADELARALSIKISNRILDSKPTMRVIAQMEKKHAWHLKNELKKQGNERRIKLSKYIKILAVEKSFYKHNERGSNEGGVDGLYGFRGGHILRQFEDGAMQCFNLILTFPLKSDSLRNKITDDLIALKNEIDILYQLFRAQPKALHIDAFQIVALAESKTTKTRRDADVFGGKLLQTREIDTKKLFNAAHVVIDEIIKHLKIQSINNEKFSPNKDAAMNQKIKEMLPIEKQANGRYYIKGESEALTKTTTNRGHFFLEATQVNTKLKNGSLVADVSAVLKSMSEMSKNHRFKFNYNQDSSTKTQFRTIFKKNQQKQLPRMNEILTVDESAMVLTWNPSPNGC